MKHQRTADTEDQNMQPINSLTQKPLFVEVFKSVVRELQARRESVEHRR